MKLFSGKQRKKEKPALSAVDKFIQAGKNRNRPTKKMPEVLQGFYDEVIMQFPDIKGKLVIWDLETKTAYGENLDSKTLSYLEARYDNYFSHAEFNADLGLHVLSIAEDRALDRRGRTVLPENADKAMLRLLDHELGHILIKELNGPLVKDAFNKAASHGEMLSEAASDAYMLIRHYQRYGADAVFDDPIMSPAARADWMIRAGDVEHFTSFVTDAIIRHKQLIDFNALSPAQTLQAARDFALVHTPAPSEATSLRASFNKLLPTVKRELDWNESLTRMESTRYKHSLKKRRAVLEKAVNDNETNSPIARLAAILLKDCGQKHETGHPQIKGRNHGSRKNL